MNTNKVYFAKAMISTEVNVLDVCDGMEYYQTSYMPLKKVLIRSSQKSIYLDLNSGEKYCVELPNKKGVIFVQPETFESFNEVTCNEKNHLSKTKIKKLAKKYMN